MHISVSPIPYNAESEAQRMKQAGIRRPPKESI